jgi:hypothetical protein
MESFYAAAVLKIGYGHELISTASRFFRISYPDFL